MRSAARNCLNDEERERFEELVAERCFDSDDFAELQEKVIDEHINRSEEEPFEFAPPSNAAIYGVMWGPSEFVLAETARLRDWSVTDRLHEIGCPTLVINGEHDEIVPELGHDMASNLPNAEFFEIEGASHLPMWEQRERHNQVLSNFLNKVI